MYNFNGEILFENIKTICELKNTTITALEREVGLSVPSISKWKDGNPTIQKILLVTNALNVSIEYLLTSDIHKTRQLTEIFLESVYFKTDIRELAWEKNKTTAVSQIKSRPYVREQLLCMGDMAYDEDLIVYSTKVGEKELFCSHFIIVNDFMDEELHVYHESWHVDILHEGIMESLDCGTMAGKLFDKLTDISYYEPRRNSLNQFMSDFISEK